MQLICVKDHDQCCLFSKFKEDLMLFSYWIFKQWLIRINLCFKKLVLNLKMELNIIFLVVNEWSGLWHSLQWTPPRHLNFKRLICLHSHSSHGAKAVLKCLPPFKKMKVIFLKAKSVTVSLYTLTRWFNLDLIDLFFWAICLHKWTIYL